MNQQKNQSIDLPERWLEAWLQWTAPIQSLGYSPIFTAYLQDSQDAYSKAMAHWAGHFGEQKLSDNPESSGVLSSIASGWATEFEKLFLEVDIDSLDSSELASHILKTQKFVSNKVSELISGTPTLSASEARLLRFNLRQLMAYADPRNSVFSNPDVFQGMLDSSGQTLASGIERYRRDAEQSNFALQIRRSSSDQTALGESIAVSKGSILFENTLMQLIHYQSSQDAGFDIPILIVPPCINRFYVLDLLPEGSLVRWLLEQGHDVYMISWVNPDTGLSNVGFDDYIETGCLAAMDVVQDFAKVEKINVLGYCIGGLMAAIAAATEQGRSGIASLTLLTTLLDYSEPGELGVFTSQAMIDVIEIEVAGSGILSSEVMSMAFTLLREEQLFWRYLRQNYLMGEALPFDALMHWGQDATNLPAKMAVDYLRQFYQRNCLRTDGCYQYLGEPIFLLESQMPKYLLACQTDHIAPADSVLAGAELLGGDLRSVLASGGHVQGVLNHPLNERGSYQVHGETQEKSGSWWVDWQRWLATHSGDKVKSRPCESETYPAMDQAPGKFVRS